MERAHRGLSVVQFRFTANFVSYTGHVMSNIFLSFNLYMKLCLKRRYSCFSFEGIPIKIHIWNIHVRIMNAHLKERFYQLF